MERVLIKDLKPGKKANIQGFVEKIRDQKTMQFVIIRDRSGKVQVTVVKKDAPEIARTFETLMVESTVSITGNIVAAPQVKLGGIEVIPTDVTVTSIAKVSPIDDKSSIDLQMDYRWIDLRDPKKLAWFKIQTIAMKAMRDWCVANDFIECLTPKTTAYASEGGSEVFEIKYFGRKAYLTQSPQLFKQMAMAAGFEKYFEITAYYRAEKSFTSRHATEFFAFDSEISFINNHHDIMDIEEAMLTHVFKIIEKECAKTMEEFSIEFKAPTTKFPRIPLLEAYDLLKEEKNYVVPRQSKGDLDPEAERLLCEIAREKYNSDFIYITDFPFAARAFYSMKHDSDPKLCKSFDLLYKGVEITSGAQREHNPEKLKNNMIDKGINPKDMDFYIQFFEYGCPPHGGYAIGLGRLFAKLFNTPSIKDVSFLFRGPDRLAP